MGGVPLSHSGRQDTLAVLPLESGGAVEEAWVRGVPSSHSGSQDTLAALPLGSGGAVDKAWVGAYRRPIRAARIRWPSSRWGREARWKKCGWGGQDE